MSASAQRIGFGGGCHWCTEAVFQALRGVTHVAQGFIRSSPPHDSWSEAVEVDFDSAAIPLDRLIEIHLRTHASTSAHSMRGKYRSAIYTFDEPQAEQAREALRRLQSEFDAPLQTLVLDRVACEDSEPRYRNYYLSGPDRPFCETYIDPKLTVLRESFSDFWAGPLS